MDEDEELTEEQQQELQWAIDRAGAIIHYVRKEDEDQYVIILPADIAGRLDAIATAEGVGIAEVVTRALERESKRKHRAKSS